MIDLGKQRRKFDIVVSSLSFCKVNNANDISNLLSKMGGTYFMIIHDKDTQLVHLHVVLVFDKNKRAKTILNQMSDLLGCSDSNIQIMECMSLINCVQYLTHKNQPKKHQYNFEDIYTNDIKQLKQLYNADTNSLNELDYNTLFNLVFVEGCDRLTLMKRIGINMYNHYYKVIQDIYKYQ